MGMSASQMRYCMLTGRKSDVEFQGQQINQQRTTLATETSAYNTQLLNLVVPTPPSSDQYVTTSYTFSSNGQTRTVAGTVYDQASGTYTVNYTTDQTTSQGESTGTSIFSNAGTALNPQYKTSGGNVLAPAITTPGATGYDATDESNIALIAKDCKIPNGNIAYGAAGYTIPPFYKYTMDGTTKYVLALDLSQSTDSTSSRYQTAISTYDVNPNATVTTSSKMTGAQVTWSSSGRMSSITDSDGNTYSLNVNSTNDNTAYEDAYNEYQYKKNVYDQQMDNINSKIDIVESQDKKLELKLQDLDTQQQALSTEMESVKKVVDKNIETSFKAFA